MRNFKKRYRDLEMQVLNELRNKVTNSNYISKHTGEKTVKVDTNQGFTELVIVNDRLTFLDQSGYHYSQVPLEDLIDILETL